MTKFRHQLQFSAVLYAETVLSILCFIMSLTLFRHALMGMSWNSVYKIFRRTKFSAEKSFRRTKIFGSKIDFMSSKILSDKLY